MIFDVTSGSGVRALNKKIKRSGAGDKYLLRWGLKNTSVIMSWSRRLILLGKYLPYKEEGLSLNLWYRFSGWVSDLREIQYIVHIKAKPDYKHLKLHTSRLK